MKDEDIEALGSPQKIQRYFEDEMDLEVLTRLTVQVETARLGDEAAQRALLAEWADTKGFGDRLAKRPRHAISEPLRDGYQVAAQAWFEAAARVEELARG